MFNTQNVTLPDRMLTEVYKDILEEKRQIAQRRYEVIRKYTNDADIEKLKELLYTHPSETYIFGGRIFKKKDIEAYIDYREEEWL